MTKKQAVAPLIAALMASSALSSWAGAPAAQLSQAQAIMGSDKSPETKLDSLYNGGGSSQQLGVATPVQAPANVGGRSLDIGAAPAASSGLDQASVPSPTTASAAQSQARVGYWDSGTAIAVGVGVLIVAAIVISAANSNNANSYNSGRTAGYNSGYNDGYNQGWSDGWTAGATSVTTTQ